MAKLCLMLRLAVVVTLALHSSANPLPEPNPDPLPNPLAGLAALDNRPAIIEIDIPSSQAQETLESLHLGEPNAELSFRNKRTIGMLRQLFPNLSQIIDQKIQQIVSYLFRTVGRSLLMGALGGGNNANSGGSSGSSGSSSSFDDDDDDDDDDEDDKDTAARISVSLPTFAPDTDSSDESDSKPEVSVGNRNSFDEAATPAPQDNEVQARFIDASPDISTTSISPQSGTSDTPSDLPTFEPISESISEPISESISTDVDSPPTSTNPPDSELSPTESISSSTESPITESEITEDDLPSSSESDPATAPSAPESPGTTPATSAVNEDENQLSEAESQQSEVRVQFTDPDGNDKVVEAKADGGDQQGAASDNEAAIDDLSLDDADASDENRNKRFLSFGLGGDSNAAASSSGSGGGSGNFLFDIIRRPAEGMARAAGQAFRILTGTDSIGLGITATHTASRDIDTTKLVAGSGGTEQTDEAANAPADGDVGKGDGYTEGIPGPVTRLFIIANRGISNLIQDLILRLAQTSERIVNFKARLITSII